MEAERYIYPALSALGATRTAPPKSAYSQQIDRKNGRLSVSGELVSRGGLEPPTR
jgi:hypothetical protein